MTKLAVLGIDNSYNSARVGRVEKPTNQGKEEPKWLNDMRTTSESLKASAATW